MTTDELRRRLARRGLELTPGMLDNDVHDRYLPPRPWADSILARATRLYRLRKLGVKGDALRLFLFLHDGGGWEDVKPVVLKGFEKLIKATQVGVRETVRNPSPKSLAFTAADAAERQRRHLLDRLGRSEDDPMQVRETTMAFIWGQGLFGEPLPQGSLETLAPLVKFLHPETSDADSRAGISLLEAILKFTGLTWKNFQELIESANDSIVGAAVTELRSTFKSLRRQVHKAALAEGRQAESTNPLTLFGHWAESDDFWNKMPERITPAQALGQWIGTCVVVASLPLVLAAKVFE